MLGKELCLAKINLALPEIRAPDRALAPAAGIWGQHATNPAHSSDLGVPNPRDARNRKRRHREKKQKKRPLPRLLALRRLRILSGRKKAHSRGPAAGNPHITRSRERAESSKTNPLQTQASRVEPAARRLLVGSGPARAAATSKEWTTRRRRRRCCR